MNDPITDHLGLVILIIAGVILLSIGLGWFTAYTENRNEKKS